MSLTLQQRNRLRLALVREPHVRRVFLVEGGEKPLLSFEYDERPPSVEAAKSLIHDLLASVAPALGAASSAFSFSAGGPEEVGRAAGGGEIVYERDAP